MPKIIDKNEMRQTIANAAINAFADSGFHTTNVEQIAKYAGMAKGTIYIYFRSKELLLEFILINYYDTLKEKILSQNTSTTLEGFLSMLETILHFHLSNIKTSKIVLEAYGSSLNSGIIKHVTNNAQDLLFSVLTKHLEHLQKTQTINGKINTTFYAQFILNIINGTHLFQHVNAMSSSEKAKVIQETTTSIRKGLQH